MSSPPPSHPQHDSICGICGDPLINSSSSSSATLEGSVILSCPQAHAYCLECATHWIESRLDDSETAGIPAFPVRCPECPRSDLHVDDEDEYTWALSDDEAVMFLNPQLLERWDFIKFIEKFSKYYCPNPTCSALLLHPSAASTSSLDFTFYTCPSCSKAICVSCNVLWHEDLTCEEHQAIKAESTDSEDEGLLILATHKSWRRCPRCRMMISLAEGCRHITCRCSAQFCYNCGSLWDKSTRRCSAKPACDLYRTSEQLVADGVYVAPRPEPIIPNDGEQHRRIDQFVIDGHHHGHRHPRRGGCCIVM